MAASSLVAVCLEVLGLLSPKLAHYGGMREQRFEKAEVWGLNLPLLRVEKDLGAKGKSQCN